MPTRRRRFSVQNAISGFQPTNIHDGPSSKVTTEEEVKVAATAVTPQNSKTKSKYQKHSSIIQPVEDIVTDCYNTTSLSTIKEQPKMKPNSIINVEKEDAFCPNINHLETESNTKPVTSIHLKKSLSPGAVSQKTGDPKQIHRERALRREKYSHQHRVKVRSPKRKTSVPDQGKSTDVNMLSIPSNKRNVGTPSINWEEEFESCRNITNLMENTDDEERPSTHSIDDNNMCRICHGGDSFYPELGRLISACLCRGTVGRVHVKCLERWLTESGKSRCELCGTRYETRRVHRYGVPRALLMWILSQNAKQLMVDSLGIMLMSPLAVLAAWLTGRTLAGMMTQENHVTPWPLASTFVLACMTLVCYYCWIVSAATRHALGWWIWYRSQYEVRLELREIEE